MKWWRMALTAVIVGSLFLLSPVEAGNLPRFDINKHCHRVAHFGGSYSEELEQCCLRYEEGAYSYLEAVWKVTPHVIKAECLEQASFCGAGSYSLLKSCVAREVKLEQVRTALQQ